MSLFPFPGSPSPPGDASSRCDVLLQLMKMPDFSERLDDPDVVEIIVDVTLMEEDRDISKVKACLRELITGEGSENKTVGRSRSSSPTPSVSPPSASRLSVLRKLLSRIEREHLQRKDDTFWLEKMSRETAQEEITGMLLAGESGIRGEAPKRLDEVEDLSQEPLDESPNSAASRESPLQKVVSPSPPPSPPRPLYLWEGDIIPGKVERKEAESGHSESCSPLRIPVGALKVPELPFPSLLSKKNGFRGSVAGGSWAGEYWLKKLELSHVVPLFELKEEVAEARGARGVEGCSLTVTAGEKAHAMRVFLRNEEKKAASQWAGVCEAHLEFPKKAGGGTVGGDDRVTVICRLFIFEGSLSDLESAKKVRTRPISPGSQGLDGGEGEETNEGAGSACSLILLSVPYLVPEDVRKEEESLTKGYWTAEMNKMATILKKDPSGSTRPEPQSPADMEGITLEFL